jgi:hypothetical protein
VLRWAKTLIELCKGQFGRSLCEVQQFDDVIQRAAKGNPFEFVFSVFSQVEHADQANDNEVDCHDKVEQPRHDQN